MSAGKGIRHSEKNDSWRDFGGDRHDTPVHFIQMWIPPDKGGIKPGYEQTEIPSEALSGQLVTVASGMAKHADATAIRIHQRDAALHAARLAPGQAVTVPDAPYIHVFVARGSMSLEGAGVLGEGDAVRMTATGGQRLEAVEGAEVLIWEMHSSID